MTTPQRDVPREPMTLAERMRDVYDGCPFPVTTISVALAREAEHAIAALRVQTTPREPTPDMIREGTAAHAASPYFEAKRIVAIWQAMYDAAPAAAPADPGALTFDAFRAANVARCLKWHPEGIESWSPSDWLTAVTGELGELASLLKMRNRERDSLPGNKFSPTAKQIADEIADVLTYLDLLAAVLNIDMGAAAVSKFNEVSERVGFPDRISARTK